MFRCTNARVFATALLVGALAIQTVPAAAAVSKADKAALKRAIVACKAEAKGKKIKWLSRRKYVNNCVTEAMKEHPNMDVSTMLRDRPDLTDLPVERWPGY
ncbi:pyruvate/2-oxoglutarate dehydrogenase complex dihydrolipoamide acyltransferase (E2) component [Bradyrhizobium sp. USDA 4454]